MQHNRILARCPTLRLSAYSRVLETLMVDSAFLPIESCLQALSTEVFFTGSSFLDLSLLYRGIDKIYLKIGILGSCLCKRLLRTRNSRQASPRRGMTEVTEKQYL